MKKFISRKHIAFVLLFLIPVRIFAQGFGLGPKIREYWDELTEWWPVAIAGIISLGFLWASGDLFGENRDMRKGFMKIIGVIAFFSFAALAVKYILSINLNA